MEVKNKDGTEGKGEGGAEARIWKGTSFLSFTFCSISFLLYIYIYIFFLCFITALAKKPPKLSWKDAVTSHMTVYQHNATTVKLQCQLVNTTPKPIITWFKNGKILQPKEKMLASPVCNHVSDGIYFFTNGSKGDVLICGNPLSYETFAGRYTCRAENEIGVDEIHSDLAILGK